jgi:AI-2 transport protein TqsA
MRASTGLANTTNVLLIILISLVLLFIGQDFLIPLVLAIITWSLLNAIADHIQKIRLGTVKLSRKLALLLAIIAMSSLFLLVYQILASQSQALEAAAPVYEKNFNVIVNDLVTWLGIEELPSSDQFLDSINLGSLFSWLGGSVGSLLSSLILVLIYTAFLFAEQPVLVKKLDALASNPDKASKTRDTITQIATQVQHYVWMKTLVSLATGLLSYFILLWVGVDFAAVWALLIFMLNFIPNLGSILGVMLPALLTLVQFDTLMPFMYIAVGLGAVQFTIGNVIEPALMGKSLNLSSLMIILSLTFWGLLWGIPGMLLSVPIMVMFAIVCAKFDKLRGIAIILSADGVLEQ